MVKHTVFNHFVELAPKGLNKFLSMVLEKFPVDF